MTNDEITNDVVTLLTGDGEEKLIFLNVIIYVRGQLHRERSFEDCRSTIRYCFFWSASSSRSVSRLAVYRSSISIHRHINVGYIKSIMILRSHNKVYYVCS